MYTNKSVLEQSSFHSVRCVLCGKQSLELNLSYRLYETGGWGLEGITFIPLCCSAYGYLSFVENTKGG